MMVCCGVIVNNGKILMIKKGRGPDKGKWCPPGGRQENNETVEETCKREMKEETNLKVDVIKKLIYLEKKDFNERNKRLMEKFNVDGINFFLCKPLSDIKEVKIGSDASDFGWFSREEALKMDLVAPAKEFLNRVNV